MINQQFQVETEFGPTNVLSAVVERAQQNPHQKILEDAMRQPLTYRRLLVGVDVLSVPLGQALGNEWRVGVLLANVQFGRG